LARRLSRQARFRASPLGGPPRRSSRPARRARHVPRAILTRALAPGDGCARSCAPAGPRRRAPPGSPRGPEWDAAPIAAPITRRMHLPSSRLLTIDPAALAAAALIASAPLAARAAGDPGVA